MSVRAADAARMLAAVSVRAAEAARMLATGPGPRATRYVCRVAIAMSNVSIIVLLLALRLHPSQKTYKTNPPN